MRDFIAEQEGRIWVGYLPPYAPELNSMQHVCRYWKHHELANVCAEDYWHLGEAARRTLKRIRRRPG